MRKPFLVLLVALAALGCQKHAADAENNRGGTPISSAQIDPRLADATNRFAFNLLAKLRDADNVMISPASIAMALAMTYNGAEGQTATEMADALEVSDLSLAQLDSAHAQLRELLTSPNSDVALNIANSLWARQGLPFDTAFLARNQSYFDAEITNLDFDDPASPGVINDWVSDKTAKKIPSIVDRISPQTILFLINAIYFKGTWTYTFDKKLTQDRVFHHPSGDRQHPLMYMGDEFFYLDGDGFQAMRLPYGKSQRFGMYVFLPDPDGTLDEFTDSLSPARWDAWMGQFASKEGKIHLPRFKITYDGALNDALAALGMPTAFSPMGADFSRMIQVPGENVYISAVKHKTFMEVNEEGTEAAAVTSVEAGITSIGPDEPFMMTVDRPFFCAITDKDSGLILFMGKVSEFE